ncbi:MAG TPA: hypothetical protein VFB70_02715 [Pyrinomonadaceae bacterium]|nr:hypothetical protein [Pyrinomonadaceae bacterium]
MRTRTEVTIEIDRWVVIQRQPKTDWCAACLRQVERMNEAALFTPDGLLFICPHSPNLNYKDAQLTYL